MKLIHKAILRELAVTFLLCLVAFNLIVMTEKLLKLTRFLSNVGAGVIDLLKITVLVQPGLFIVTTPLSFLMAVLLTYGRLDMDNELTAMRAGGMSLSSITLPVRLLGIACFLISILFSFYIAPAGSAKLRQTVSAIVSERAHLAVEEGTFNMPLRDVVIHVSEKTSKNTMRGIFIYDGRDRLRPRTLLSREGRIYAGEGYNLWFHLKDGLIHIVKGNISTELFFDSYKFSIPLSVAGPPKKKTEFTPLELIKEARKTKDRKDKLGLLFEFHRRLSFPALSLVLIYLSPGLALMAGRTGRLGGLVIGFGVFAAYYAALIYGERLSEIGNVPHWLGAWAALILLGIAGIFAFRRAGSR